MELLTLQVHKVLIQEKGKFLLHFIVNNMFVHVVCMIETNEDEFVINFTGIDNQDNRLISFLNSSHEWKQAMQSLYGISSRPFAITIDDPLRTPLWGKDPLQLREIEVTGEVSYTLLFTEQDGQEKQAFVEITTIDNDKSHYLNFDITSDDKTVSYRLNPREIAHAILDFHNAFHEEKLEW